MKTEKKAKTKNKQENLKIKNKKFRILAAGDLHGNKELAEKLAKRAEKEKVFLRDYREPQSLLAV